MKKRTKISLRTKIYLTIVALLALTGVFYAQCPHGPSTPGAFVGVIPFPTGVAAAPDLLLVSEYCSQNIDKVDCNGVVSLFATLPVLPNGCQEKYMAIAPSQSMVAGFTPRDVFVTEGNQVFQIGGIFTPFAVLNGCGSGNHTGITFDHTATGIFGNDMIVTCQEGNVYRIHGNNNGALVAPIANVFASGPLTVGEIEGPAVVPLSFGPALQGGKIWVADELNNRIHTIGPPPTYLVSQSILFHDSAEGVFVIPNPPCTFTPMGCLQGNGNGAFFLAEQQLLQLVWQYPLSDFTIPPIGGNVILTSESGGLLANTSLVTVSGGAYVQCSFGPRVAGNNEGASFVDCDVPTATPTTTPTTPTPTPTPTATGTPPLVCPNAYSSAICSLGAFGPFAVLVLDSPVCPSNVDFSSPDTLVQGDIGLCGGTSGAIKKLTVDGDIVKDTTPPGTNVTISNDVKFTTGHGVQNQDLSAACGAGGTGGDCRNASQCASALACTQNVGDLTTSMTFTGNGGLNVICINNINLVKATITILGGPSDTFIFNVTGPGVNGVHTLNDVKTTLVGVTPSQILWNVTASNTTLSASKLTTRIVGTWLVPNGSFILDKAVLNGSVCAGCTVRIHSAAQLICPEPTPTPTP